MKTSRSGKTVNVLVDVWRQGDKIMLVIKGNPKPSWAGSPTTIKRDDHPDLFSKLEVLLDKASSSRVASNPKTRPRRGPRTSS